MFEIFLYYCDQCKIVSVHEYGLIRDQETHTFHNCRVCDEVTKHRAVAYDHAEKIFCSIET